MIKKLKRVTIHSMMNMYKNVLLKRLEKKLKKNIQMLIIKINNLIKLKLKIHSARILNLMKLMKILAISKKKN